MDKKTLRYTLALTLVPGIGTVTGKKLINVCGNAENVFTRSQEMLKPYPRLYHLIRNAGGDKEIWKRADEEVRFIEKYNLKVLCFGGRIILSDCRNAMTPQ